MVYQLDISTHINLICVDTAYQGMYQVDMRQRFQEDSCPGGFKRANPHSPADTCTADASRSEWDSRGARSVVGTGVLEQAWARGCASRVAQPAAHGARREAWHRARRWPPRGRSRGRASPADIRRAGREAGRGIGARGASRVGQTLVLQRGTWPRSPHRTRSGSGWANLQGAELGAAARAAGRAQAGGAARAPAPRGRSSRSRHVGQGGVGQGGVGQRGVGQAGEDRGGERPTARSISAAGVACGQRKDCR